MGVSHAQYQYTHTYHSVFSCCFLQAETLCLQTLIRASAGAKALHETTSLLVALTGRESSSAARTLFQANHFSHVALAVIFSFPFLWVRGNVPANCRRLHFISTGQYLGCRGTTTQLSLFNTLHWHLERFWQLRGHLVMYVKQYSDRAQDMWFSLFFKESVLYSAGSINFPSYFWSAFF